MKIWTTQTEKVLKIILDNKTYKPNFKLSDGLGSSNMKPLYQEILKEYKLRNRLHCDGLIFGISNLDDMPINDVEKFRDYFFENNTFWDSVSSAGEDYSILELEIPNNLDLMPIYFQDFIILGLRNLKDHSFTKYIKEDFINEEFHDFKIDLKIAQDRVWVNELLLNRITQVHFHQISIDNIVNIYPSVNFTYNIEYDLNDTALKLKDVINRKKF